MLSALVRASLLRILISATYSSFTSTSLLTLASPRVAVKVYVPAVKLAVESKVTVLSAIVALPSILLFPFVTSIVASAGTSASKVATKVDADVAFNSVIFPRVGQSIGCF